jgi:pantoate--beta-alanine ligase
MRTLRTVAEVRTALRPARRAGRTVGLVPTMGALHEGHAALIQRAAQECDEVVVSLFVNPKQFGDARDLAAYPRDADHDAVLAAEAGADLLWAPSAGDVYPAGFVTQVVLDGPLVMTLEGAHRGPEHFTGVATVVVKLLNAVQPDTAFFGQKDAQQVLVIRRVVADLDMPVRIEVVPTRREDDGLARSSRNSRLSAAAREQAPALRAALAAVAQAHRDGVSAPDALAARGRAVMISFGVEPEYLALVDPKSLAPVTSVQDEVLVALAATIGGVRLIDNQLIGTPRTQRRSPMTGTPHTSDILAIPTART